MASDCCLALPMAPKRGEFVVCLCGTIWRREIIMGEHRWERVNAPAS